MIRRFRARPRITDRERGAGLVEYALLFGVVVVVLIGAIQYFTDSASDEIDARSGPAAASGESIGSLSAGPATTVTTSGGGPPPGPGTVVAAASVGPLGVTAGDSSSPGNKWDMSVTISVIDSATSSQLEGAVVSGVFNSQAVTCTTGMSGSCIVVRQGISNGTTSMAFTLTSVTYANPAGSTPPSATVTLPTPGAVTCDRAYVCV